MLVKPLYGILGGLSNNDESYEYKLLEKIASEYNPHAAEDESRIFIDHPNGTGSFVVEKLDVSTLPNSFTSIIVGAKNPSVRSNTIDIIKNIVSHLHPSEIHLFKEDKQESLYSAFQHENIHTYNEIDGKVLDDIIKKQQVNQTDSPLIIFNDNANNLLSKSSYQWFIQESMHNISTIFCIDSVKNIHPLLKTESADLTFIFHPYDDAELLRIYQKYTHFLPSYEIFISVMDQCTFKKNHCVVIDKHESKNKLFFYNTSDLIKTTTH